MYLTGKIAALHRIIIIEPNRETTTELFGYPLTLDVDGFLADKHLKRNFELECAILKNYPILRCDEFIRPGIVGLFQIKPHIVLHPLPTPWARIKNGFDAKWLSR